MKKKRGGENLRQYRYTRDTSRYMFSERVKVPNSRRIIAEMLIAF
ncbi:hypothetical protein [uncultured Shewanella sp.]|nr:hypothetical protein [uncultured Shewanella sp.]